MSNDRSPSLVERIGEEFLHQCLSGSNPLLDGFTERLPVQETELHDFVKVLAVINRCKPDSHDHESPNAQLADPRFTDQDH